MLLSQEVPGLWANHLCLGAKGIRWGLSPATRATWLWSAHGKALPACAVLPWHNEDLTSFCHSFCHLFKLSGQVHISMHRPFLSWWAHSSFSSLLSLLLTGISSLSAHSFSSLYCLIFLMNFFLLIFLFSQFTLLFLTYFLFKKIFSLYNINEDNMHIFISTCITFLLDIDFLFLFLHYNLSFLLFLHPLPSIPSKLFLYLLLVYKPNQTGNQCLFNNPYFRTGWTICGGAGLCPLTMTG